MKTAMLIGFLFVLFLIFMYAIYGLIQERRAEKYQDEKEQAMGHKSMLSLSNYQRTINKIGRSLPTSEIEVLFNRSKNPWNMRIETFQAIRIIGLIAGIIILIIGSAMFEVPYGQMPGLIIGGLSWFYPTYYYRAIGNEREEEFNKIYEFIWVIKNNMALYDPQQSLLNTHQYLVEHAPQNEYMIEFFKDYYERWDTEGIDPYLTKYYPFSISREITSIVYNSYSTGISADSQLDQLRIFAINAHDKSVIKILSEVPSSATLFSLPFMLIAVIIAMLVPMLMQFMQYMN